MKAVAFLRFYLVPNNLPYTFRGNYGIYVSITQVNECLLIKSGNGMEHATQRIWMFLVTKIKSYPEGNSALALVVTKI